MVFPTRILSLKGTIRAQARGRAPFVTRCASEEGTGGDRKRVVVVGGGWAGFGAARHLADQGYAVTLLDAADTPGGLSAGWRTSAGRPVEAGIKGFWYDYPNIYSLLGDICSEWPLTPYLKSGFWGADGLITEAPVFSELPQLPTLLGQLVFTSPLFYKLPLSDRLSILPWLYNIINLNASPQIYERYDKMSAYELFRRFGVSERAYELFLKPTLAVGLFAPPEQLSAAAVLETLYFYALSHQNNFDVCWCKGSISEKIFMPLVKNIEDSGGKVLGGRLVTGLVSSPESNTIAQVKATLKDGREETYPCDALILAISISGMQKLISNVPELGNRREFGAIMNLKSIDCIATRLWFDEKILTRFPANVLAGFENDVGCTYFNLSELQDDLKSDPGTVIAADFYGASELLPLSDEEIVRKVHRNITRCEPAFSCCTVLDSAVLRFPRAVTHFSPGSYTHRPRQVTSLSNTFLAGDYIKGLDHGANGLSQERAYVAGLAAANYVVDLLGVGETAQILPVNPDEPHVALAKRLNGGLIEALRLSFP